MLSIASQFQAQGEEVKVFDLNHKDPVEFWKEFHDEKPDIVGISVYTSPIVQDAKDLAHAMKGNATHKPKLVAGGIHATHMPESLTDEFDLVIRGEGENGLEAMKNQTGIVTLPSPDLNKTANIDYNLLDMSNYGIDQNGKRTGTMITSRGCFGNCAFCGKLERKIRFEPLDKVFNQISSLKAKGFESVYFLDDVFTANKDRMEKITDYAKKEGMPFRVTTRADLLDDKKMQILAKNGCEWLSIGIESGDNEILKKSNKGMTWEENQYAVQLATQYGIKTKGFFIIGLPGETEFTAQKTISFSKNLKNMGMAQADFYFLTPFPGTPIWNNPESFDIEITDRDYTKYLEAGKGAKCYVNTKELKAERIEEIVKEAKAIWK